MAKTPKVKNRAVSVNSRAARRGASPSTDVTVQKVVEEADYKPWLHRAQNAGISKKTKPKSLSRQQRLRQQRGAEKADATTEKLAKKVADSKSRARKVHARRADWDELNEKLDTNNDRAAEKALKKAMGREKAAEKEMSNKVDGLVDSLEDVFLPESEAQHPEQTVAAPRKEASDGVVQDTPPAAQKPASLAEPEEDLDEVT